MTDRARFATAALGILIGGLVAAGYLLATQPRPRPEPPRWEEYQRPNGMTCVGYRGQAVSCFWEPTPPTPTAVDPLGAS